MVSGQGALVIFNSWRLQKWSEILDDGDCCDIIYLDFKKAFDSVSHKRLLVKLESIGIKGQLQAWIQNFIEDRRGGKG